MRIVVRVTLRRLSNKPGRCKIPVEPSPGNSLGIEQIANILARHRNREAAGAIVEGRRGIEVPDNRTVRDSRI